MKQTSIIVTSPYPLVSSKLIALMQHKIESYWQQNSSKEGDEQLIINFRDTSYSAESGGYHPVEVMLLKKGEAEYQIQYLTDFAYMGNYYPELERNVDFDVVNEQAFIAPLGWHSVGEKGINEFYQLWEANFISYVEMGAFNEIVVTSY
ncbi:DUF2787 domain-containing protein [Vibrio vulnificus]|nr:DUF2787 domain-containing protein [Vibrio vulnificus]